MAEDLNAGKKSIEFHEWGASGLTPWLKDVYPDVARRAQAAVPGLGDDMARGYRAWAENWVNKSGRFLVAAHTAKVRTKWDSRQVGIVGVDADAEPTVTDWNAVLDYERRQRDRQRLYEELDAREATRRAGGGDLPGSAG